MPLLTSESQLDDTASEAAGDCEASCAAPANTTYLYPFPLSVCIGVPPMAGVSLSLNVTPSTLSAPFIFGAEISMGW